TWTWMVGRSATMNAARKSRASGSCQPDTGRPACASTVKVSASTASAAVNHHDRLAGANPVERSLDKRPPPSTPDLAVPRPSPLTAGSPTCPGYALPGCALGPDRLVGGGKLRCLDADLRPVG